MSSPRPPAGSLAGVLPGALAALGVPGAADPLGLAGTPGPVRQVAVLLVDGLGYHLLPAAAAVAPILADPRAGLRELSSAFPSTTPTSLVTLGTGVLPGAHGVLGFTVRIPGSDRLLTHILWRDQPAPQHWQPVATVFATAHRAELDVAVVGPADFAGSGLTVSAYGGARYVGTSRRRGLAEAMAAELRAGTRLVYGYHATLDTVAHLSGVASPEWRSAATEVGALVDRLTASLPADSVLLVVADHGCLDVPAAGRLDVDTDPRLSQGVRLVAGEPRVRYLHTVPGASADVAAAWGAALGPSATILTRAQAVDGGWFGTVPAEHLQRIGDLVVVCGGTAVVVASRREPPIVARMVGFHGSVTPAETAIPLLVYRSG